MAGCYESGVRKVSESGVITQALHACAHNKIQILDPRNWAKDRSGRTIPPPFVPEGLNGAAWRQNTGVAVYGRQAVRFGIPGQPDILGVLRTGVAFGMECKIGKGKTSAVQYWYHGFFSALNMRLATVRDYEQADAALKYWLSGGAA